MQGVAKTVTANQEKREKEISKQLYGKDGTSESQNNEYFKQIAAEQGLTENDFTGNDKDDLEILYAKMAGINRDEIAEGLKGDKKELAQEIARLQAANEAGVNLEKTYKRLSSLDKKT
jgi:hypothetical protein